MLETTDELLTLANKELLRTSTIISGQARKSTPRLNIVQQVVNTNFVRLSANHGNCDAPDSLQSKGPEIVLLSPLQRRNIVFCREPSRIVDIDLCVLRRVRIYCVNQRSKRLGVGFGKL